MDKKIFLAKGAHVTGQVSLGNQVGIWYNAVVRGDCDSIQIGNGSNVQDNVTIHTDKDYPVRIGEYVSIGHNAVVHGCTIGDNTVIGMGAILLNGAVIGKNCIIGPVLWSHRECIFRIIRLLLETRQNVSAI